MPKGELSMTLDIKNIPEVIAELRREMAEILREAADVEASIYVRGRLHEIAAAFEVGASPDVHLER